MASNQALCSFNDTRHAAKAVMQRVVPVVRVDLAEAQNPGRCGVAEGIEALVVVTSDEQADSAFGHAMHESQIHGVEILKLIDDEVLDTKQLDCIQGPGLDAFNTQRHNLARKHAGVELGPRAVEPPEPRPLRLFDRRIGRDDIRRLVLPRLPVRLVVNPDLFGTSDAGNAARLPELGLEHVAEFPALQNDGVGRVSLKDASSP